MRFSGTCASDPGVDYLDVDLTFSDPGVLHGDSSQLMNNVDITWHPTLGHLPYARRHAAFIVNSTSEAAPAPFRDDPDPLRGRLHPYLVGHARRR